MGGCTPWEGGETEMHEFIRLLQMGHFALNLIFKYQTLGPYSVRLESDRRRPKGLMAVGGAISILGHRPALRGCCRTLRATRY